MTCSLRTLFIVTTIAAVLSYAIATDAQYTGLRGLNKAYSDGTHVWEQTCQCQDYGRKTLFHDWHCSKCGKAWTRTEVSP